MIAKNNSIHILLEEFQEKYIKVNFKDNNVRILKNNVARN